MKRPVQQWADPKSYAAARVWRGVQTLAGKRVLITGATAGIGLATAQAFVGAGAHVICAGRRKSRLQTIVKKLNARGPGTAEGAVVDVSKPRSVATLRAKGHCDVDIVVNNAGLARGKAPIQDGELADWKEMLDTNVLGLLAVFQACAPALIARQGHVVNLGSVAGRWVYPGGNVYSATKFAVRSLSESMRIDLQGTGVRVTNIAPGAVDTEFSLVRFRGDRQAAAKVYDGYEPLHAEDIAETIVWSCARPAHVNIQELVIFPTAQASVRDLIKTEPEVVDRATIRFEAGKGRTVSEAKQAAKSAAAPGGATAPQAAASQQRQARPASAAPAAFPPPFRGRSGKSS